MPNPERTLLERITSLLLAASAVVTPVVVAVVAGNIQQSITKQTTAKDFVSLAIEILRAEPKKGVLETDPLRDWAVEVLRLDSPVKMSDSALAQLRSNRLVLMTHFR